MKRRNFILQWLGAYFLPGLAAAPKTPPTLPITPSKIIAPRAGFGLGKRPELPRVGQAVTMRCSNGAKAGLVSAAREDGYTVVWREGSKTRLLAWPFAVATLHREAIPQLRSPEDRWVTYQPGPWELIVKCPYGSFHAREVSAFRTDLGNGYIEVGPFTVTDVEESAFLRP